MDSHGIYAEHFAVDGNKYIYMAMTYLYSKQIKPTPMSIMEVITSDSARESIEELGGLEYLTLLDEQNVPLNNLSIFLDKVKQSYIRRMLYTISDDLREFVLSSDAEKMNPSELIAYAEGQLNDLAVNTSNTDNVYKMGDETEAVLAERAENPDSVPGLEVGWANYDRYTNGALGGDCIIVCAESKVGKSVTLTNWANNLSIKGRLPGLYIDTEMSSREQEDRLLSNLTGIPHSEILSGMYVMDTENGTADEKVKKLKAAREELKMGEYYHIYMPHFSIEKVTAIAKQFVQKFGIKYMMFDYIKIPSSAVSAKNSQEYQQLGFFTSGLKDIAGVLNIPVFTACQANRSDLGGQNPDASSIGGSYRILQLATKLMFLVNKSDEQIAKDGFQCGNQQLFIKYQRNGASDVPPINIFFNKPILRQSEV